MKNRADGLFRKTFSWVLAAVVVIAVLFITCTIKDDNGSIAVTGPNPPIDTTQQQTDVPVVVPYADSTHVGIGDTLSVTVYVFKAGTPPLAVYPGVRVHAFMALHGKVWPESLTTNSLGQCTFKVTDTAARRIEFKARCQTVTASLFIDVTNTPSQIQKQLTATPQRAILRADGHDSTMIDVLVLTPSHTPMAGETVKFLSTAGIISSAGPNDSSVTKAVTNRDGYARIKVKSTNFNDTAFVTVWLASDPSLQDQTKIVFQGVTVNLTMDSSNIRLLGSTAVTATLLNASGEPIPYSSIYFNLGDGTASCMSIVSKDSTTGADGIARAVLRGETAGSDSLVVVAAGATAQVKINVTNLVLSTSLDVTTLQARETKSTTLHAVFTNASGQVQAAKTIKVIRHYLTREGAATTDTISSVTGTDGKSDFVINALPYEGAMRLEVLAFSGTDVATSEETIRFITSRSMTIYALPAVIQADGTSKSTITVLVKNEENNPLVGETVLFKSDAGVITASAVTGDDGKAAGTITSDRRNAIAHITATLEAQPDKSQTVNVEFSGVTLALGANPPSIRSSGADTCFITLSLNDAARNPIAGEPVSFYKRLAATSIVWADTVTNNRGEARCKIVGTGTGVDSIMAEAAGASDMMEISYSSNTLVIDTAAGQSLLANGTDTTAIVITYTAGDGVTPIPSATVRVSVTLGSVNDADTVFAKAFVLTSGMNGQIRFSIRNPGFANTARISVTATTGSEVTSAAKDIYFKAARIHHIALAGTPEVISTNGDRVKITAVAFDSMGNRVKGETVSFNLLRGPGGGEVLDPPTAQTNDDGTAVTYLVSGSVPSTYKSVWVVAGDFSANKSDTVKLTIAGPPHAITIRSNILEGVNYKDGTFGLPCAAIVVDVNGNPVADGTEVTFSVKVSGYATWRPTVSWDLSAVDYYCNFFIDSTRIFLPFEDFNDNFSCDPGEDRDNDRVASRGEDLDGDGKFITGPSYEDINNNGKRDYRLSDVVEPSRYYTSRTWDSTSQSWLSEGRICYADFNHNNKLDTVEPLTGPDAAMSDSAYADSLTQYMLHHGGKGFDVDLEPINGIPDPNTAVAITRTVQTVSGKATNIMLYGQSDATRIEVMIFAESQGIITLSPDKLILPIIK